MLIAHRGSYNNVIKENSIEAFKRTINDSKYAGFELDVYTSKDGEFVVNHNPIVNNKFIWKQTFKELKKEGLIKLEDVLKLKTDKIILIEIKDINIDIKKFSKLLTKYKDKNIYVMSFFNSVIKKFGDRTFKVGVLNYVLNSTSTYNYDFIGILYDIATNHIIESFKGLKIEVFLYAINKKDKYIFNDVYYIVNDY